VVLVQQQLAVVFGPEQFPQGPPLLRFDPLSL
jgi:hypothetical protein